MNRYGNVLIVDDEEIMREILETLLTREGYQVRLASSGAEGLEMARALPFDAAIVDIMMPGLDGIATLDELKRIDVDLNAVITDVFSLLEHQFAVGSIKVRRELSPLPATVLGIEHQLQQVFLNLFLNARDAMPRGGWLSVATRVDADRVIVEIADTGSGIPSEQIARIYDPFFTTKSIGRGTGLGLSITYGIVREHDGTIDCESAVGQGTRFTLALPLAPASARSARAN